MGGTPAALALSNGTLSNWSTGQTYAATGLVPGSAANVLFSATSGATQQANLVLGSNMTINSLTFSDSNTVTIANDGNTLTLMGTGTGTASAISATQNAAINANVALGAAQTWTVAASTTLTIGGPVSGTLGLTTAGPGTVLLSGTIPTRPPRSRPARWRSAGRVSWAAATMAVPSPTPPPS